jgi:S1-C subfamily serine protease
MAGVASGLALATTLMAMQVADSMSVRQCPYRVVAADVQSYAAPMPAPGQVYLGIHHLHNKVLDVVADSPASVLDLQPGDRIASINGAPLRGDDDLQDSIRHLSPGDRPTLLVERNGVYHVVRPTLATYTSTQY